MNETCKVRNASFGNSNKVARPAMQVGYERNMVMEDTNMATNPFSQLLYVRLGERTRVRYSRSMKDLGADESICYKHVTFPDTQSNIARTLLHMIIRTGLIRTDKG